MNELLFLAVFMLFFVAGTMMLAGVVILLATASMFALLFVPVVVFAGVVGITLLANEMAALFTGRK